MPSTASLLIGGAPFDTYFSIATPGRLPTHAYGDPLVGGEDALLLVASAAEVAAWYADAGTPPPRDRRRLASLL